METIHFPDDPRPPWLVSAIMVAPLAMVAAMRPKTDRTAASMRAMMRPSAPDTSIAAASRNAEMTTMSVVAME